MSNTKLEQPPRYRCLHGLVNVNTESVLNLLHRHRMSTSGVVFPNFQVHLVAVFRHCLFIFPAFVSVWAHQKWGFFSTAVFLLLHLTESLYIKSEAFSAFRFIRRVFFVAVFVQVSTSKVRLFQHLALFFYEFLSKARLFTTSRWLLYVEKGPLYSRVCRKRSLVPSCVQLKHAILDGNVFRPHFFSLCF